eukprot:754202-Hanusia_phi.AAC.5
MISAEGVGWGTDPGYQEGYPEKRLGSRLVLTHTPDESILQGRVGVNGKGVRKYRMYPYVPYFTIRNGPPLPPIPSPSFQPTHPIQSERFFIRVQSSGPPPT